MFSEMKMTEKLRVGSAEIVVSPHSRILIDFYLSLVFPDQLARTGFIVVTLGLNWKWWYLYGCVDGLSYHIWM